MAESIPSMPFEKDDKAQANLVDKHLSASIGGFTFDEKVAQYFDDHVRKSVPMYDEIQRMILEMSDWFIQPNSWVYDLGCATGETINRLSSKFRAGCCNKNPYFMGVDESEAMIEKAAEKLKGLRNVSLRVANLNSHELAFNSNDTSLVLMLYTLQFVKPAERLRLLTDIYKALIDNGALIVVEKIVGNNPRFNEMWIELFHDMKLRNGLTLDNIKAKSNSLRGILMPYSFEKNIELLEAAGFRNVDVFFKWYNFIGLVAVK